MTAALKERAMSVRSVHRDRRPLAANAVVKQGWLAARNAAGYFVAATGAGTEKVVGRFRENMDNTGGANGARLADVEHGRERWVYLYANDGTLTIADREKPCTAIDNQTFGAAVAGQEDAIVYDVTTEGVWVEFYYGVAGAVGGGP